MSRRRGASAWPPIEKLQKHVPDPGRQQAGGGADGAGGPGRRRQAQSRGHGRGRRPPDVHLLRLLRAPGPGEGRRLPGGLDCIRQYWGAMLDLGATTFWEDFDLDWTANAGRIDELVPAGKKDIHGDFGNYCYKGFRHSLCHGWASGPTAWLSEHVLGVQSSSRAAASSRSSRTWAIWPGPKGPSQPRWGRLRSGTTNEPTAASRARSRRRPA